MQGTIYLNQAELSVKIENLKIEKEKLKALFNDIKKDTTGMPNYWSGTSGDKAYETLNKRVDKYTIIINQIESYIKFLESTLSAYKIMDDAIKNKMEENADVQAI